MYDKGQKDGGKILARSLTDVLVGIKESGLGSASIMEESNAHATFRVFQSLCCQIVRGNNLEGKSCYYLAGFIAGAIEGIGGSREVESRELSCGGFGGRSCIFIARW
jgi:predicted hydrocarbon binding protein